MAQLKSGDQAPQFTLLDQNGKQTNLADLKGRKVLVYFYPKADTPGCTRQACSVRDAKTDLAKLGVEVIGISPDTPQKQKKFDAKHTLGFPLLSDPNNEVAKAFGAWGEKSMYGKKYEGIMRSSLLLDEEGKVIQTWYKVSPEDTVPKAEEALGRKKG